MTANIIGSTWHLGWKLKVVIPMSSMFCFFCSIRFSLSNVQRFALPKLFVLTGTAFVPGNVILKGRFFFMLLQDNPEGHFLLCSFSSGLRSCWPAIKTDALSYEYNALTLPFFELLTGYFHPTCGAFLGMQDSRLRIFPLYINVLSLFYLFYRAHFCINICNMKYYL